MAKLGLLTIYNQDWGITRYVDRFLQYFGENEVVVFAETVSDERLLSKDNASVRRCWKRTSTDYRELSSAIDSEAIDVLHVNCCYPYFESPQFAAFIESCRAKSIRIVAHVQDRNAFDAITPFLSDQCDAVLADNADMRHAAVASGISREKVEILESAADRSEVVSRERARAALSIPNDQISLVCFEFGLPEAKIEDIIAGVYQLQEEFPNLHLHVLQVDGGGGFDGGYAEILQKKVQSLHLDHYIHFVRDTIADSVLPTYLSAADAMVLSGTRPQFEVREAFGLALAAACPVISVHDLPFSGAAASAYMVTPRRALGDAIAHVLRTPALSEELSDSAKAFCDAHDAKPMAEAFAELYGRLSGAEFTVRADAPVPKKEALAETSFDSAPAVVRSRMKILMMNRSNALSHRGGDTVVMERVTEGLMKMGHHVDVDVEGKRNPKDYDLAHLYNFAIRESTEQMARRCVEAGTPYVVTTMYEDWPLFYNQMANHYFALKAYAEVGQPKENWQELSNAAKAVERAPAWDNTWTAHHSAALIATGTYEAESLRRDYPKTPLVEIYRCGHEVSNFRDDGSLFRKETGIDDFVLCVGRLEWRKNQLMLLKALEDSDLTVVFATGGFTYQPEYEQVCRSFKRRGKTVYLGRLDPDVLASAFCAARLHVLPSWFELPGLVSLEAAHYGTNVVVTDYGTARDYLGTNAYYCSPDDDEGILNAVTAAYYAPTKSGLQEQVKDFTWEKAAERNLEIYHKALDTAGVSLSEESRPAPASYEQALPFESSLKGAETESKAARETVVKIPEVVGREPSTDTDIERAETYCTEGDEATIDSRLEDAQRSYEKALDVAPHFSRALRSLGVVSLGRAAYDEAEQYFRAALREDPRDVKSLVGLGAVQWERGEKQEAFDLYLRAAENDPGNISSVLYLVNAAYELNKLPDLENALRSFLKTDKQNTNIQYCLAGCYFRQEKFARAEGVVERILQVHPSNKEALELREEIVKRRDGQHRQSEVEIETETDKDVLQVPENMRIAKLPPSEEFPSINGNGTSMAGRIRQLEEVKRRKEYTQVILDADAMLAKEQLSEGQASLVRILKAEAMACEGDVAGADLEFAQSVACTTYAYRALSGRGALAASLEQWGEAEKLFRSALERQPDYDPAIAGLGIVSMGQSEQEAAWSHFQQALSINCENMQALLGLVQLGYATERFAEVEAALVQYLDIHPVDLSMLYTYAGCLYAQGRVEEAEGQCRKVMLFEPGHELAVELLAKIEGEGAGQASAGGS